MNVEIKNIEIKSITKIGTDYNNKKLSFTQKNQKLYQKGEEIGIKRIKMKKFAATNNNFKLSKDKIKNSYNNNLMHRQSTFNKLKNQKKDLQNKEQKQIKDQKSTIISLNQNSGFNHNNKNDISESKFYTNKSNQKETKKIMKNLSRENMYINASNINNTFNNFLLGGTQRKKISFKENENKKKNNKILQLYNLNNNIYNDEITLINNTKLNNDIYTTNYTTKNNKYSVKNAMMGSENKIKKDKKIKIINKYKSNLENYMFNPSMKIDINNINNIENNSILNNLNNNIKKIYIRSDEKKVKNSNNLTGNNNKKNVVKNIKDIIIENSNKNNLNLINSFKSEVNILNTYSAYNTFNTNDSKKKESKKKYNEKKIQNLKVSQRGSNSNEFNSDKTNNFSCKNNKNKPKNKVIKLKDVNNNFNYIINNGINFNSTVKNSNNNNIYITYINNTSSSKTGNKKKKANNICHNNFHINKSNSNLILNSNISKEKINNRNSLIKLNTLQNEEDVKKHIKNIYYKSKINFSPPKIPFFKEKHSKKYQVDLKRPNSNKHLNKNEKINYSPRVNSIPKYVKTESNIANINIMNNNNIFINKLDLLDNYALSTRKDNIFSKINNYILKGHKSKDNFINLLNKRKLSDKIKKNSRGNSLMKKNESKERDREMSLNKKIIRKIDYNNDTIINANNNKNSFFNYGAKTTKNLYKKDILLSKKYSFINVLKPKTINKLKRYTHNINKEELNNEQQRKEHIKDNSKLIMNNNNKSLTFIYKEKKKTISSLLKQKNFIKLIHMIDELNINNSKLQSKSKKKNKSSQHINFVGSSSKKQNINNINVNIKLLEDKNIIDNVIQNNMTMYSIYILSKYEKNFSKIGIYKIRLYNQNNEEIFILYSNANINNKKSEEENINYLFNKKNRPFISEFRENLYINFYINVKKANNLKYIEIINYENKKEEISAVKKIKIYQGKKKLFNGILNINGENIIDISKNIDKNNNSNQIIPKEFFFKKRGNSASNANNKTNIYNINYINYKKNNNYTRSFSTFRQNSGKKINKIPRKQIGKMKSERYLSPKQHLIKSSNIYNNTEINEDTYYDNNNIIIYNICNTIPYNNYNDNEYENKDEIYIRERFISDNDLEKYKIHEGINLTKLNLNNYIDSSKLNTIYPEEKENNDININYVQFKIIRLVLSSNYGNNNCIGLTGLEFYDKNNKLINIETAETIGALPKDLHTVYNNENDNRIFENIFNGENNTDDSFNMWVTLFDKNKNENHLVLPYIEISFKEIIYLSKIKFYNYNQINQLDKCLKTVDVYLDNKFFTKINLRQGLGIVPNIKNIHKKEENIGENISNAINNDYSQDITFPLNNEYYEKIDNDKNKYNNIIFEEEKGLDIDFASLKYEQSYETPFMPNGFIIKFQLINNYYQGKIAENNINNNKTTNNINNISVNNNNYIGINITHIYDQHGNDLLLQKEIKYKIVSNKEIIIIDHNKYILYYTSNDDNNNLFFLFETPINISYIEIQPFSFLDNDNNYFNSVKDIKIFCDTNVIFEGPLYQYNPTIILFTNDNKVLKNINTNYLTKSHLNREYIETKTENYYSMAFT